MLFGPSGAHTGAPQATLRYPCGRDSLRRPREPLRCRREPLGCPWRAPVGASTSPLGTPGEPRNHSMNILFLLFLATGKIWTKPEMLQRPGCRLRDSFKVIWRACVAPRDRQMGYLVTPRASRAPASPSTLSDRPGSRHGGAVRTTNAWI